MSSRRKGPAGTPVTDRLKALTASGALAPDPLQLRAAAALDRVATELGSQGSRGLLSGLFGGPEPVRGVYLVGQVGRGKTMLMDLFFSLAPTERKRRVHFHEFMDEMHAAIAAFRKSRKGRAEDADPVAAVTKPLLEEVRLLCLDEFQVQDITNAMLLGRLFDRLFRAGVTIVATSNTRPDDLYENGLNRQLVLPFIAELKRHAEVVELDGPTDYRRLKFEGEAVYRFGTGPEVDAAMDRLWLRLTGGLAGKPTELVSLGRRIAVPHAAMGAARFDFADLCDRPLGARDYLRLSHAYEAVMVEHVPQFDRLQSNAAKRFILLVDTLYDRGVKLAASFAVPLDELGQDDKTEAEFARCVSRLIEMQSAQYLAAAPRNEQSPAAPSQTGALPPNG
ncbi:cell division protein ZapE [Devosia sp.]|uniref:cell division protein ZapE n=1 Tax=Devosia sp. TaxID=1871048 RepID=UPI0025BF6B83|nr:cell division protein ZapE [Devosia sp.]